ncbi:SGNH/GDSL hydrolase family protein [Actinacidiphila rubida]|uniref:Lysophospholipase L1 n=1 Tax=Actinacidiphila rubida TaxID=310780 RepID=A0A1H8FAM1_9ACTN|nr:SGNH/GDSL hydrolase family protein [Actinacidiphila rubida]SEN28802.1 Lysophospholipase L1 [Actinacidiphila rubida]
MRSLSRSGLALAVTALLLAGCGAGGARADRTRPGGGTPTAQISHSAGTGGEAAPGQAARPDKPDAPEQQEQQERPWNVRPASVASLGDSITRGFDACDPFTDCPAVSWATGTKTAVHSLTSRLAPGTGSWNLARSGARVADLPAQARAAAAHHPAMVTVLIGANDACAATTGAMTPVADFRTAFNGTLAYLHRVLPGTQVLVASIPDLQHLWSVGRTSVLGRQLWRLGLCPTMLKDPDVVTAAANARRAEVRNRVIAYNTALAQVCQHYDRCRFDGGAVFRFPFSSSQLSKWDFFHPNQDGQAELAKILAGVASGAVL